MRRPLNLTINKDTSDLEKPRVSRVLVACVEGVHGSFILGDDPRLAITFCHLPPPKCQSRC